MPHQPLDRTLRRELERTIQKARDAAEAAASTALNQLGVGEAKPYDYLSDDERDLRRRLRVHGRQLGDERQPNGVQETIRLLEEVAYEHWHRMLFARFLAENTLLMYPDPDDPVPVTLAECEDLAEMEGLKNGWEVAARYAGKMLPQIFREASPVFELTLPPEYQQQMEQLLADLPPDVFTAQDSLGWVYQFWQAKRKDEVNASEVKIGARELPAVTQLFTEPYMVSFLLDNSLGAWWAARRLSDDDLTTATSEDELREKASIDGVPLDYLRFVRSPQADDSDEESGKWTPAAGTFDAWPATLAELKTLDPCCGSGHFLVAALLMLAPMRAELENLTPREAVDAVLRDNLHGLELDQRCVEIAAFALALEAWRYDGAGGYRPLPEIQVACSGLSVNASRDNWIQLSDGNQNLKYALSNLHLHFENAEVLGSLINPRIDLGEGTLFEVKWDQIAPLLTSVLDKEQDVEKTEMGVVALGLSKAAKFLAQQYHWVITNVPYLALGKQSDTLKQFSEERYPTSKNDLATVFLERCIDFLKPTGNVSIVLPQNWLFLKRYQSLRVDLLKTVSWRSVTRLGAGAFDTISGEVVKAILISIDRSSPSSNDAFASIDLSEINGAWEKSVELPTQRIDVFSQLGQLKNPESRVVLDDLGNAKPLDKYAVVSEGLHTGDYPRFGRKFWEITDARGGGWAYQQGGATSTAFDSGMEHIMFWEDGDGVLIEFVKERLGGKSTTMWIKGDEVWDQHGVCVSSVGDLKSTRYTGALFTHGIYALVAKKPEYLPAIQSFCVSDELATFVRKLDQKVAVSRTSVAKVPFDLEHWQQVAEDRYPNGLPAPYFDDPTQWIFHGHPCGSVVWDEEQKALTHGNLRTDDTVLQVAVARLLGYRWPAETDADMELSAESREWVGRSADLLRFADKDGIVCIPSVRGERPASERLLNLLAAAYGGLPSTSGRGAGGEGFTNDVLGQLLASVDHAGKTLDTWLRDKFFEQHYKMFNHRPFIWHIWDGLRDGFSVLVNYHTLDYKGLETFIYTYLGDWISRQKSDIAQGVDGAQERLAAAEALKTRLEQILEGESPHDIFIRWKPLEEQPVGWQPDLNDGVLVNIRPFMTVQDVSKKGAGVLRSKPNIKWTKDRGRDVETAPWYHLGPQYGGKKGDRINDHHLTLAEKQAAHATKGK